MFLVPKRFLTLSPLSWTSSILPMVPRPLVICGPSGCGKTTLLTKLEAEFGDCIGFSVSHTTRKPRPGEENGREYNFVDRKLMESMIEKGEFIEFTEYSGNMYGTSKKAVKEVQNNNKICILDVEIEGVKNLKKTDLSPKFVFIMPPSMEALEKRLRGRGTETEESIAKRLQRAKMEMEYGTTQGNFDLIIVNDDVNEAYKRLREFLLEDVVAVRKSTEM